MANHASLPDAPQPPPRTFLASLRCLGPGMILAGGIVGGVGQSLVMAMPVTSAGEEYNLVQLDSALSHRLLPFAFLRRDGSEELCELCAFA